VASHNFSFPVGSPWTLDISNATLDSHSNDTITWLSQNGGWGNGNNFQIDMSFNIQYADSSTPHANVTKKSGYYSPDCDTVTTIPLTVGGNLEGNSPYTSCSGDCHYLVVDQSSHLLYESYSSIVDSGKFKSMCIVTWDLTLLYPNNLRGDQCTSADAAGFPIAPLVWNADEIASGTIDHAVRFVLPNERMRAGVYVHPGTHAGSPNATGYSPVYGSRWRLKSSFNPNTRLTNGATAAAVTVVNALKKYGMFLADGGDIVLTSETDKYTTTKYDDINFDSHSLFGIQVTDFEVIDAGSPITLTDDCVRNTFGTSSTSASGSSTTSSGNGATSASTASGPGSTTTGSASSSTNGGASTSNGQDNSSFSSFREIQTLLFKFSLLLLISLL